MDYCYSITAYKCYRTDGCYYCCILVFVKDEMVTRRQEMRSHKDLICQILECGKKSVHGLVVLFVGLNMIVIMN